jgi:hypothetical protein
VTGRHSVIDSPEPVSRVSPPTAIITTTSANSTISQTRIAPRAPPRPRSIMPPCGAAGRPRHFLERWAFAMAMLHAPAS